MHPPPPLPASLSARRTTKSLAPPAPDARTQATQCPRRDAAAAASEGRSCSRSRGAATSASVAPSTDVAGPTSLSRSPADADEAGAGRIRSLIASLKTSTMLT